MGVKMRQVSDENWMTTFNRIHNPWMFRDEKKKKKTGKPLPEITEKIETGGPKGPEPTRYGDWERKGRAIDF